MLKQRQLRKQTQTEIEMLENRVRLLQRHEKTTEKRILLQKQQIEQLAEIRMNAVELKNKNEARKIKEEIELEKRKHVISLQKQRLAESRHKSKLNLAHQKQMLI